MTFIRLDVDDDRSFSLRNDYNMTARNRYVVVDADGEEVTRWIGALGGTTIEFSIRDYLRSVQ